MHQRLMIIDDERVLCDLIREVFAREPLEVTCVRCGRDALKHPLQDLYVVDLRLPGLDGFETLMAIQEAFSERPRAILMTGFETEFSAEHLALHGVQTILRKPFNMGRFKTMVREALSLHPPTLTSPQPHR